MLTPIYVIKIYQNSIVYQEFYFLNKVIAETTFKELTDKFEEDLGTEVFLKTDTLIG